MPGHLIRRAGQVSNALFAQECAEFDITSVQFAALLAIESAGEIDNTRLAEAIAFDRATIGDVIDRLHKKGWIDRVPSPTDRRAKLSRLTAQGTATLRAVEPCVARVQEGLLRNFSVAEGQQLLTLLKRLEGDVD